MAKTPAKKKRDTASHKASKARPTRSKEATADGWVRLPTEKAMKAIAGAKGDADLRKRVRALRDEAIAGPLQRKLEQHHRHEEPDPEKPKAKMGRRPARPDPPLPEPRRRSIEEVTDEELLGAIQSSPTLTACALRLGVPVADMNARLCSEDTSKLLREARLAAGELADTKLVLAMPAMAEFHKDLAEESSPVDAIRLGAARGAYEMGARVLKADRANPTAKRLGWVQPPPPMEVEIEEDETQPSLEEAPPAGSA